MFGLLEFSPDEKYSPSHVCKELQEKQTTDCRFVWGCKTNLFSFLFRLSFSDHSFACSVSRISCHPAQLAMIPFHNAVSASSHFGHSRQGWRQKCKQGLQARLWARLKAIEDQIATNGQTEDETEGKTFDRSESKTDDEIENRTAQDQPRGSPAESTKNSEREATSNLQEATNKTMKRREFEF